jgi:hypothetical protein
MTWPGITLPLPLPLSIQVSYVSSPAGLYVSPSCYLATGKNVPEMSRSTVIIHKVFCRKAQDFNDSKLVTVFVIVMLQHPMTWKTSGIPLPLFRMKTNTEISEMIRLEKEDNKQSSKFPSSLFLMLVAGLQLIINDVP